eukprot:2085509-Alexandrium_andersonii.AAC.1
MPLRRARGRRRGSRPLRAPRDIVRAGVINAVSDDGINSTQQEGGTGLRGLGGCASWGQLTHLK